MTVFSILEALLLATAGASLFLFGAVATALALARTLAGALQALVAAAGAIRTAVAGLLLAAELILEELGEENVRAGSSRSGSNNDGDDHQSIALLLFLVEKHGSNLLFRMSEIAPIYSILL